MRPQVHYQGVGGACIGRRGDHRDEARRQHLQHAHGRGHTLKQQMAARQQCHLRDRTGQVRQRLADQHLAGRRGCTQPRRQVQRRTAEAALERDGLARVQPDAHP